MPPLTEDLHAPPWRNVHRDFGLAAGFPFRAGRLGTHRCWSLSARLGCSGGDRLDLRKAGLLRRKESRHWRTCLSPGIGIWLVKSWGRSPSLALVAVWLSLDVIGFLRHGGAFHVVRVLIDAALVAYLLQPKVLDDLLLR